MHLIWWCLRAYFVVMIAALAVAIAAGYVWLVLALA